MLKMKPHILKERLFLGLASIFLIFLTLLGYTVLNHRITDQNGSNYSSYSTFVLPSKVSGAGITFTKPAQLNQTTDTMDSKVNVHFNDTNKPASNGGVSLVNLAVATVPPTDTLVDSSYIAGLKGLMQQPGSDSYKEYIKPLTSYVQQRSLKTMVLKFGDAKMLDLPSLKGATNKAAWKLDFYATDKEKTTYKAEGSLIYITTPKGFYYFFVMANESDWIKNQAVWTKIINSIKVDQ